LRSASREPFDATVRTAGTHASQARARRRWPSSTRPSRATFPASGVSDLPLGPIRQASARAPPLPSLQCRLASARVLVWGGMDGGLRMRLPQISLQCSAVHVSYLRSLGVVLKSWRAAGTRRGWPGLPMCVSWVRARFRRRHAWGNWTPSGAWWRSWASMSMLAAKPVCVRFLRADLILFMLQLCLISQCC
jgi:hypothetical protein